MDVRAARGQQAGRAADEIFDEPHSRARKEQFEKLSAGKEIPEFGPGDT